MIELYNKDCLEEMHNIPDGSVDAVVTDPPYEIGFMGKGWDDTGIANNVEMWKECLRVLKTGGYLLSFSATRTYHRMAVAIEDAGFEIRDMIEWIYGSGFPKSHNISKAISKKTKIGLCTCVVHKDCLSLQYEKDNKQRDNISNGDNDRFSSGEQIQNKGNDDNEMEKQIKDTNVSSNSAFRKESKLCELSENNNKEKQGYKKVSESILQSGVCKSISENKGLRNAEIRTGLEKSQTTSKREGQGLPDMRGKTENRIRSSSSNTIQNGGQELNEKFSGTLSELPQQNRKRDGKGNRESKNDRKIREWKIDDRFICPKCRKIKSDIGGSSLKPAHEPICMARKPLSEKTVAENVLKHGTGGINIDECRVGTGTGKTKTVEYPNIKGDNYKQGKQDYKDRDKVVKEVKDQGRFPANLIHDGSEEVRECFPDTKGKIGMTGKTGKDNNIYGKYPHQKNRNKGLSDSGNASRYFKSIIYQAKASKSERNAGLEGFEEKLGGSLEGGNDKRNGKDKPQLKPTKNHHPTVKPIALIEYLVNMVTPKEGTVLDPFMGSGTTGIACKNLNRNFIGIEMDEDYFRIAEKRINGAANQTKLFL